MAFKHEVFISYRHIPPKYGEWVKKAFYETINDIIVAETGNKDAVYIDTLNLAGENWKKDVFPALIHSKIILTFWTPLYFQKDCVAIQEYVIANNRRMETKIESLLPISITERGCFLNNPHNLDPLDFKSHFNKPSLCKNNGKFNKVIKEVANMILQKIGKMPSSVNQDYFDIDKWGNYDAADLEYTATNYVNLTNLNKNVTKSLV